FTMPDRTVDLNADMGEGCGNDATLAGLVTSANVACGFHAGDPMTMRATVDAAVRAGIVVGAHPGYPDPRGFGRRDLAASPAEITADVLYQIGALQAVCHAAGTRVRYVKAHGALYNRAAKDVAAATAIAEAVRLADPSLVLLCLAGSLMIDVARDAGLVAAREAFADRAYTADGSLVSRSVPGSVLTDPGVVAARAVRMVTTGEVETLDGAMIRLQSDSLCVHGDTPGALEIVRAVRRALTERGITLRPFANA
ncbi:MAG TPA: 5-oxoprolinase subunit PxpA, partial [Gemmatimonadaceae bacterium]|nr:5-oxoprolinase subunit PxpA [Gemmatimonadaceae bacterium]